MTRAPAAPSVSVVIPTIGRESLTEAIASVQAQSSPATEIIVAFDGPAAAAPRFSADVSSPAEVTVVATGGSGSPNVARNLGVTTSRGSLVAFLDDDDLWHPEKLERQLTLAATQTDDRWVATSAVRLRGERAGEVWPSTGPTPDLPVSDYLFVRSLRRRRPFLQTSTWLAPRELLLRFPLRDDLPGSLHDDFDWLIRTEADGGLRVLFSPEPLTTYTLMNGDSFARRTQWTESLAWAVDPTLPMSRRARGDFALGIPFRLALQAGGRREALRAARAAWRSGRPSTLGLAVAAIALVRG